jgi:uncharacterized protein YndB with AHSA1/START domain
MNGDETVAEVRHRLASAPAKVFAAFSDASLVSRWLTPSPEVALTMLEFDFCIGGAYRFAYHVPDGATMFVNGVYRIIEPPSKIVFSWNIEPPDEHAGIRHSPLCSGSAGANACGPRGRLTGVQSARPRAS